MAQQRDRDGPASAGLIDSTVLRWLAACLAVVPLIVLLSGFSETWISPTDHGGMAAPDALPSPSSYPRLQTLLASASPQVRAGAQTFHLVCATCHGPTGEGLAEARMAFVPSDRHCESCHRPGNPPRWADLSVRANNSFSIGHPPPLRGTDLLQRFDTPSDLFHYIRGAMPRYDPGKLSERSYVQLTAFLLALNGAMPPDHRLSGPVDALRDVPTSTTTH